MAPDCAILAPEEHTMKFMVPKMISIVDQPERALVSSKGRGYR
jgi:hypothetical protein